MLYRLGCLSFSYNNIFFSIHLKSIFSSPSFHPRCFWRVNISKRKPAAEHTKVVSNRGDLQKMKNIKNYLFLRHQWFTCFILNLHLFFVWCEVCDCISVINFVLMRPPHPDDDRLYPSVQSGDTFRFAILYYCAGYLSQESWLARIHC